MRALIQACPKPRTSLAGWALTHGLNANLLSKWVVKYQRRVPRDANVTAPGATAFVPIIIGAP